MSRQLRIPLANLTYQAVGIIRNRHEQRKRIFAYIAGVLTHVLGLALTAKHNTRFTVTQRKVYGTIICRTTIWEQRAILAAVTLAYTTIYKGNAT